MISISEVLETNKMIQDENLDVRTITMGVSLLDCADANLDAVCRNIYAKLLRYAGKPAANVRRIMSRSPAPSTAPPPNWASISSAAIRRWCRRA